MKKFLYSLSGLGLVSILVMGASVSSADGDKQKSPLRGAWSWSQFVPATTAFGTPSPIPTAAAGTLFMNADNSFTGHAVLNTPWTLPLDRHSNLTLTTANARFAREASRTAWTARSTSQISASSA
jgi:hypothetical protein